MGECHCGASTITCGGKVRSVRDLCTMEAYNWVCDRCGNRHLAYYCDDLDAKEKPGEVHSQRCDSELCRKCRKVTFMCLCHLKNKR